MISRLLSAPLVPAPSTADNEAAARARRLRNMAGVAAAIIVLFLLAAATTPGFLTLENMLIVLRAASITGIVALGMAYLTLSGNLFALSAEELAILAACVFAWLMRDHFDLASSIGLALIFAAAAGALQGAIIALGADPIITTLAFGALFRGLSSLVTQNKNILLGTKAAEWLGTGRPLGVPTQSWAFVLLTIGAWFVLQRTRFGRVLLLIGANRNAAAATGLRVGQASLIAMTLFGLCCGIAGISAASQFGLAVSNLFTGLNIDVVAAVLVGGISLRGGQGSPIQAALGAVFIALLQNFMLLHSFTAGQRMLVVGCLVAVAAAVGALQGLIIALTGINSLVFTIGTLIGLRGLALVISNENSVTVPIERLGETDFINIRYLSLLTPSTMVLLVVCVLVALFLRFTLWGREIYAIGGGRAEARAAGVSILRPMILAFALSGTLAGLGGAIISVKLGSATPLGFDTLLLSAVTACLMGGIGLEGGKGSILGIVIGLFTLRFLVGGVASLGAPYWLQSLAIGALLIIVIVVQLTTRTIRNRKPPAALPRHAN
jgi:simple sugar transport system permease protein/ribose transport system permease protein